MTPERIKELRESATGCCEDTPCAAEYAEMLDEIERLRTALENVRAAKMPGEARAIAVRALTEQKGLEK